MFILWAFEKKPTPECWDWHQVKQRTHGVSNSPRDSVPIPRMPSWTALCQARRAIYYNFPPDELDRRPYEQPDWWLSQYWCDGLSESKTHKISRLNSLTACSWTTSGNGFGHEIGRRRCYWFKRSVMVSNGFFFSWTHQVSELSLSSELVVPSWAAKTQRFTCPLPRSSWKKFPISELTRPDTNCL